MNKLFLLICLILTTHVVADSETIKTSHENNLTYYGDVEFFTGQHQTLTEWNIKKGSKLETSLFSIKNGFSFYKNVGKEKYYITCKLTKEEKIFRLHFTNRLIKDLSTQTIKYNVDFYMDENFRIEANVDKQITDARFDFFKIVLCILQFAPDLLPVIKECTNSKDILQCILRILDPATKLFECIFEKNNKRQNVEKRNLFRQNFYFSNEEQTFKKYYPLGNLEIIEHHVYIRSQSGNVTFVDVSANINEDHILEISLDKLGYSGEKWDIDGEIIAVIKN